MQHVVAMGSLWVADKKAAIAILQGQITARSMQKTAARKEGSRGGCSFLGAHQSQQLTLAILLLWLPVNHAYVSSVIPSDFSGTGLQGCADLELHFPRCERSPVLLNPVLTLGLLHLQEGLSSNQAG